MIYLDHNATTPIDPAVLDVMQETSRRAFGNPGSRHLAGRRARQALEDARELIAEILQAHPEEVTFTSGGTESSNLAITGLTVGREGDLLSPLGEHPATEEPLQRLMRAGRRRIVLPMDARGRLDQPALQTVPLEGVALATALLAHNETGVIQELKPFAERCVSAGTPFYVDAVQAVGKIDVSFRDLPCTAMSFAAHKFHGPRGIGGLLVRRGVRLQPFMLGGHQERDVRPGTEPVVLAVGMAEALRRWHDERAARTEQIRQLRDRLEMLLAERCAPVVVNGDPGHRLANTLHIAFPGCDADALLVTLDLAGVCCSLGSACASGSSEPAPVLLAMGLPNEVSRSSLRLSLGKDNAPSEIDEAAEIIAQSVRRLRGQG